MATTLASTGEFALHWLFARRTIMPSLICPLCQTLLATGPRTWRCGSGHTFDVARDGHVNLLPVQFRKSRSPGDPPRMVEARREFLQSGHYAPLRDAVAAEVAAALGSASPEGVAAPPCILDLGCGEGYYTSALAAADREVVGIDIAKPAIAAAARRLRGITWLVAGGTRLPMADQSIDVVTSLFAPLPVDELVRVCRSDATLLVAIAGAGHLAELRTLLFDQVREHEPERVLRPLLPAFTAHNSREISHELELDQADVARLLDMTPYAWRARPERVAAVRALPGLKVTVVLRLASFRPRPSPDSA